MSRKFLLSLSALSLLAWCAVTIACGNSSKNKSGCTGGPYNVVGNWQITVSSGSNSLSGYGAIDSAGLALFFDNSVTAGSGDTLEMPTLTGTCSFSGNITDFAEPGGPASGQIVTDTTQGTLTSATALNGTFTGNGVSGNISASSFSPLTGTVAVVVGSKTGHVQGAINGQPILLPLTFSASGTGDSMSFSGSDTLACAVTGTFTQVATANVFDVSMTFSNAGSGTCPLTGTPLAGIGFESSSDYFAINGNKNETYLYADILDSGSTFVMEIY